MKRKRNIVDHFKRARSNWRRLNRLVFMSPAEAKLVEILGGQVYMLDWPVNQNGFKFTYWVRMPELFKDELVRREVRIGRYYADYCNDIGRVIEVDGKRYHDIVADFDRDSYMYQHNYQVLRIPAARIYNDPDGVRLMVTKFLTK